MPCTIGVSPTTSPATHAQTVANFRGVRITQMSACSSSRVNATFWRTSTARNDRHRSSLANCRWANLPIGNFTK